MKYLNTYEKYQLSLFPDIEPDKVQDVVKRFAQFYKPRTKKLSNNQETTKDVLRDYDSEITFNRMCNNLESIDDRDKDNAAENYFYKQRDILIDYLKDTGEYGTYFDDIDSEEDRIKAAEQYIKRQNINIIDVVSDYNEFLDYIKDNYEEEFNYADVIESEYWDELIYILRHDSIDNKIPIYRSITIPKSMKELESELGDFEGIGVYWSYSEDGATAHCGRFGSDMQELILKAWVQVENVNWDVTFERSIYSLKDEREVYLKAGYSVELYEIYLPNRKGDIMKNFNPKYFEEMYDFDNETMIKIRNSYEVDAKDKSTIVFEPPIDIKV